MSKLEYRYYSDLNLCWAEKTMEFDGRREAEEYLDYILKYDRVAWAKIDGKAVEYV